MGRLTEAAAAGGGASAARSAGPPPAPLSLSSTSPGCAAAMASSEEDGTNGGASEASEEREAVGKRRRLGLLATIWLTFYNIAMTAGYERPEGALPTPPRPRLCALWSLAERARLPGGAARGRVRVRAGSGVVAARGYLRRRGACGAGRGRGRPSWGEGRCASGLEWSGAGGPGRARPALPNTVHGARGGRGARAGG